MSPRPVHNTASGVVGLGMCFMRFVLLVLVAVFLTVPGLVSAQELSAENDPQAIPDLRVATGNKDIASAWLIVPTKRYPHFIIGSDYEPSGVRLKMANGDILTLMLEQNQVFEDRTPRLADLDGDGRDELILVLTSVDLGGSLAAFSVEEGQIKLKAQTPYAGQPFRWLNPANIADFNGDGKLDVALVQKPHLVKKLEIWTLENGDFVRKFWVNDVSNHRISSPFTDLSAAADFNGDGIVDLAILNGNYSRLRIFSFAGSAPQELENIVLPAPANGDFKLTRGSNNWLLSIPLTNGQTFELSLPRQITG
jgi:FG-GAP-like repeat